MIKNHSKIGPFSTTTWFIDHRMKGDVILGKR